MNENQSDTCFTCFNSPLPKPLDISTVDLLQEWHLDVPLDIQIKFQTFIYTASRQKSRDKRDFIKGKLDRLYSVYDILLYIFNNHYFGVHQQANMDELSMHFNSINTVFAITRSSGITSSLPTAEKRVQKRSGDDNCHYNTFLKKYS